MKTLNFNAIYSKHYQSVLNYLQYKGINTDIAEEICNDVFLKVYNNLNEYDSSQSELKTWLFNIAKNCMIDHFRSSESKRKLSTENVSDFVDSEGRELYTFKSDVTTDYKVESVELWNKLKTVIGTMNKLQQKIAELTYINELSYEEVAKVCDIPLNSVKGNMTRVREICQKNFKNEHYQYAK